MRNFVIVLLTLTVMTFLFSCKPPDEGKIEKSTDSKVTTEIMNQSKFNLQEYSGEWFGENYKETPNMDGELMPSGAYLSIRNCKDTSANLYLTFVSMPPASRIAEVEESFAITDNIGAFVFDDDGWENSGKGTIKFEKDRLIVEIIVDEINEDANWRIFKGKLNFYRHKPNS